MEEEANDFCSQINLLSSIQYQQKELSKLAKQLQSEKDREKYIKVIEMSKIIQAKLDHLQTEKNKSSLRCSSRINSFGQGLNKKNSMWSLNNTRSSTSSHTYSVSTTATSSRCSSSCGDSQQEDFPLVFSDSPLFHRNQQIFHGHTYRVIDRVTSLQFQQQQLLDSAYNGRRPSADTILSVKKENDKKKQIVYMKPTAVVRKPTKKRQISFSPLPPNIIDDEEEESEEEEEIYNTDIHVAVRKDASILKIGKATNNPLEATIVNSNNDTITEVKQDKKEDAGLPTPPSSPQDVYDTITEVEQDKKEDAGLPTPPDSPQDMYDINEHIGSSESDLDLITLPQIIHVHKKSHQSLKGLLKRSYQLNQYTVTKTNSTTLSPTSNNLLFKTVNATNGKPKLLLKVIIVSLISVKTTCDKLKRFGFTFWWQNTAERQLQQVDSCAKFALAPDSLVKEALATWIDSQNEQSKGAVHLPSLSKSDEILRDGRKIYVVYDTSLFSM